MTLFTLYHCRFFLITLYHYRLSLIECIYFMSTIFSLNYISDDMSTISSFPLCVDFSQIYLPNTIVNCDVTMKYRPIVYIYINFPQHCSLIMCGTGFKILPLQHLYFIYLYRYYIN
jgi:hypothetical protein